MKSKVIVRKVTDNQDIKNVLSSSIIRLGERDNIASASRIVIKPNLCCMKSHQSGATTDVALIDCLIEEIREINATAQIRIIESNNASGSAWKIFKELGYNELENHNNVKLVNMSVEKRYRAEVNGRSLTNMVIPETLIEMDYFVSVAKLKTSILTKMTGILKNQFGCLTKANKKVFHPFLSQVLTDINSLFKPDLCILEGCPGMSGFGPVDGNPIHTDLFIVGNDPVATDCVGAQIMGFKPKSISHLKYAAKHGVGQMKDFELVYDGVALPNFHFEFVRPLSYRLTKIALLFQKYGVYLINLSSILEKIRSAMCTVGVGYVQKKVTYSYALKNIKSWIFRQDG